MSFQDLPSIPYHIWHQTFNRWQLVVVSPSGVEPLANHVHVADALPGSYKHQHPATLTMQRTLKLQAMLSWLRTKYLGYSKCGTLFGPEQMGSWLTLCIHETPCIGHILRNSHTRRFQVQHTCQARTPSAATPVWMFLVPSHSPKTDPFSMQQLHHASCTASHSYDTALLKEISALSKSLPMVLSPMSCGTKLHIPQNLVQDTIGRLQSFATTPGTNSPFSLSHGTQCIFERTRSLSNWHSLDACASISSRSHGGLLACLRCEKQHAKTLLTFLASQLTVIAILVWSSLSRSPASVLQVNSSNKQCQKNINEPKPPKNDLVTCSKSLLICETVFSQTHLIIQELPASLWQSGSQ